MFLPQMNTPARLFSFILPVLQVALFVTLLSANAELKQRELTNTTDGFWEIRTDLQPTSLEEILYILNGPVALFFVPVAGTPEPSVLRIQILIGGLLVFWLWSSIGRWIDRRRGALPRRNETPANNGLWVLAWIGLVSFALIAGFSVETSRHWWAPGKIPIAIAIWAGFACYFLIDTMLRWRAAARQALSSMTRGTHI
jgi:hypothetical protein